MAGRAIIFSSMNRYMWRSLKIASRFFSRPTLTPMMISETGTAASPRYEIGEAITFGTFVPQTNTIRAARQAIVPMLIIGRTFFQRDPFSAFRSDGSIWSR